MIKKLLLLSVLFITTSAQAGWVSSPTIITGEGTSTINENNTDLGFGSGSTTFPHWIGTVTTSGTATFWTKVPILYPGNTYINMYYNGTALVGSFSTVFTKNYEETGLKGLWHLDDGSGSTTAIDSSGMGNTGTLVNMNAATDWQPTDGGQWDGRAGVNFNKGSCLDFDGANDYVSIPVTTSVFGSNGTIEFWFKPTWNSGDGSNRWLISGTDLCIQHYTNNNWYIGWTGGGDWRVVISAANMPTTAGNWYYFTMTWNDTTNQTIVYMNGVQKGSNNVLQIGTVTQFNLAADLTGGTPFTGWMDDVRIHDRILPTNEIISHYERRKYAGDGITITVNYGAEQNNPGTIYPELSKMRTVTINNSGSVNLTNFQIEIPVRIGSIGGQEVKD
ncbi:MAG: LamG domain-containing protein [Bacillota bacterium]